MTEATPQGTVPPKPTEGLRPAVDGWRPSTRYGVEDSAMWPPRGHVLYSMFHDARLEMHGRREEYERLIDSIAPVGGDTQGAPALASYGPGRCEVCGWTLAQSPERGCVPGDCSYRPDDPVEARRIDDRRKALAAAAGANRPTADDDVERCIACDEPFKPGEMVMPEKEGGEIHAACAGPEREGYFGADGEPLKDGEPIPTGYPWKPDATPAPAMTIPPGYALVPEEPTEEMVNFGTRVTGRIESKSLSPKQAARATYRTMLAAAPTTPDPSDRSRAAGEEWEPIETAPRDGTPVDLWVRPHDAFENGNAGRVPDAWFHAGRWRRHVDGRRALVSDCGVPTHWRPLSAPPGAATEG